MRTVVLSLCMVICLAVCASSARAQGALDQRISELSLKISNGLTENQKRTIAVVEFADLRGNVTDFGRFIAEELITHLYETKKFKVIERQLLNKVVAEQKLSLTGMIDQTSAQKLGKLLGVDAIASGTITDLGKSLRVNARLIDTSTGEIFAVASTEIVKDDSVITLTGAGQPAPTNTSDIGGGTSYQVPNAVATKDIGSLRIVLKSIMPLKLKDRYGRSRNGIKASFEFLNRDLQRPMVVAMNANAATEQDGTEMGTVLRTSLVDERGTVWGLSTSDVTGMSVIGVGRSRSLCDAGGMYNPAEIVLALQRQDDTNSQTARREDCQTREYQFIFGSTTPIPPGQGIVVTMSFVQDLSETTSGPSPKFFQISTEFAVGVVTADTKKSYSLQNVIFDRLKMPGVGS